MHKTFETCYADIQSFGYPRKSRAGNVRYLRDQSILSQIGEFPYRKGSNPAIGFIEGLQFIAGTSDIDAIAAAAPHAKLALFGPNSFYGPKTAEQFPRVIAELNSNHSSRRAVLMVTHLPDTEETRPCTLSVQFQISNGRALYTTVTMRSSDMVWGMPYDLIQFGVVARAVAWCTGSMANRVVINTANAHIYDNTAVPNDAWELRKFTTLYSTINTWEDAQTWAAGVVSQHLPAKELLYMFNVRR